MRGDLPEMTTFAKSVGFLAASLLVISTIAGCLDSGTGPEEENTLPLICPYADDTLAENEYDPEFRVISPNGGEIFHVGQQCSIHVTCREEATGTPTLIIGPLELALPDLNDNFRISPDTILVFTIPDSLPLLMDESQVYSIVSDSCVIRFAAYEGQFPDHSDCYFAIRSQ